MNSIKINIIFLVLFFASPLLAQSGNIRGTVFDDATGESIPGVTVLVEGTTTGSISDLDGKFDISIVPGSYVLRLSFVSYETLIINDIQVIENEVVLLDNLRLKSATIDLAEVVVTASIIRNNETALLTLKRKSPNLMDGISSASFRKIGDTDAASSMKRVPGVSVEGGKYVFVRGLGDRYTKTTLNGVDIPGLDPDRNTLQMDIFPTNVIDNIIVHKSFSPELGADFTGGAIDINIKDFPDEKSGNISLSLGYNPAFHLNNNYLTYTGGETDWLGYDDGSRAIPATTDIPFFAQVVGNPPPEPEGVRYREILENFNPTMAAFQRQSFIDYSIGANYGNQVSLKKSTLGYNLVLSYKNNTEFYKDALFSRYGFSGDPDIYEMDQREYQKGDYGVNNVMLGGMGGLALKFLNSKYSLTLLHLQNGESKAGIFDYTGSDQGSIFFGRQHNLDYSQRSLSNLLLEGKHTFVNSRWNIEWKLSPTLSKMYDPDIRFTRYINGADDPAGPFNIINTESGFPERIWRDLEEVNLVGQLHITKEYNFRGQKAKLNFGGAYTNKERDYTIQTYALNIRNVPLQGHPDELFLSENLWPREGNVNSGTTYEAQFVPVNPNQFNSTATNTAGYISTEVNLLTKLKTVIGVRTERYLQRYTGQDQLGTNVLDNDIVLDNLDFFPSINLIYNLTEMQNLRLSYSKTIARPSFKELSYAEIYDPITTRTFIGGLFRDANDLTGEVFWDGNLVSTDIHNFDLRWELFHSNGQMVSVSAFYKSFLRPIEIVQYVTQTGSFQPRNVGDGQVIGTEIEFRQNFGFISESLQNFSITTNLTLANSRIKLSDTEYKSRVDNARTGQNIDEYRVMAGQSPFIINTGLSFDGGETGFGNGLEAGFFYNVQSRTLQFVGIADRPDIYNVPFHSLNFNANKNFGGDGRFQVGIKIDNILNDKRESVFQGYEAEDQFFTSLAPGTTFQVRFGYSFF